MDGNIWMVPYPGSPCVMSYAGCDSAARVRPGQAGPRYFLILSSSDQLLNPTQTRWFLKQGLSVNIFVQHKVPTLCFVSLVIFTIGENNNFRNKAKCSYLNDSGQVRTNQICPILFLYFICSFLLWLSKSSWTYLSKPSQNRVKKDYQKIE